MTDKKPRPRSPLYHVFRRAALPSLPDGGAESWVQLTSDTRPVQAASRQAAIEAVAGEPKELPDGTAAEVFFVIPADEMKVFQPRVKIERSVSWETIEPPAPLRPDPARATARTESAGGADA